MNMLRPWLPVALLPLLMSLFIAHSAPAQVDETAVKERPLNVILIYIDDLGGTDAERSAPSA